MMEINKLKREKLRTGEEMDIFRVLWPDEKLKKQLLKFLSHKRPFWIKVLKEAFENKLDRLKTYCYIGKLKDRLIANITIMRKNNDPVNCFTHVFTAEKERRKGVTSFILKAIIEDLMKEEGQAMYLQTGYRGPAWRIYSRYGFKDLGYKTGTMGFFRNEDFLSLYFSKRVSEVRELNWADLAKYYALSTIEKGWFLRSVTYGIYGVDRNSEANFYKLMGDIKKKAIIDHKGLFSENGAMVGLAFIKIEPRWNEQTCTLDFFLHPNFYDDALRLISALKMPEQIKLQSFADSKSPEKMKILKKCKFIEETILKGQISDQFSPLDVIIYRK